MSETGAQYLPSPIQPIVFDPYAGLNTEPSRPSIEDNQASVLDGFMPIGKGNARTIYGVGRTIFSAPSATLVVFHWFGNIAATPYCVVFLNTGAIWVSNTNTGAQIEIAPAGTIVNPSQQTVGITQWGSERFIIVAQQTNGYFIWDGTFYKPGDTIPGVSPDVPTGISGTAVETYAGHVWVFDNGNCEFSAPASYTDFTTNNGGGSFASSDSFLRRAYVAPSRPTAFSTSSPTPRSTTSRGCRPAARR